MSPSLYKWSMAELIERDGPDCQICGEPEYADKPGGDITIDHLNGDPEVHTLSNLRRAHRDNDRVMDPLGGAGSAGLGLPGYGRIERETSREFKEEGTRSEKYRSPRFPDRGRSRHCSCCGH